MKTLYQISLLMIILSVSACASKQGVMETLHNIPTRQPVPRPISQAIQTVNLPHHKTWSMLRFILKGRNIKISTSDKRTGNLKTDWLNVTDFLCSSASQPQVPIRCSVRFFINIRSISKQATSVAIRYVERCLHYKQFNMECPGSKAEKLMLQIIKDLKAASLARERS